jgi:peroxiredoxin
MALATTARRQLISNVPNMGRNLSMLQAGDKAPDFSLQDENSATRKLSEFRGRDVVLFFYPKANTPG